MHPTRASIPVYSYDPWVGSLAVVLPAVIIIPLSPHRALLRHPRSKAGGLERICVFARRGLRSCLRRALVLLGGLFVTQHRFITQIHLFHYSAKALLTYLTVPSGFPRGNTSQRTKQSVYDIHRTNAAGHP